jgi:hypothetical protein
MLLIVLATVISFVAQYLYLKPRFDALADHIGELSDELRAAAKIGE